MADLIDLLAAHAVVDMTLDGGGVQCKCQPRPMDGTCMWSPEDQAAHVALVVEQHTNGRITELKADLREEAPYAARGHAMDDPDISNCGDSECPGCEYDADALRAEKAEATIADIRTLAVVLSHSMTCPALIEGICTCVVGHLRAALEGEQ